MQMKKKRGYMIKKLLMLILAPLYLMSEPFHNAEQIKDISESVVKIYTTSVESNYYKPWLKGSDRSSSGTGVIIGNHLILTSAHVVSNGVFIQVKKNNDAKKYIARAKWIDHEADLALVEVEDKHFFNDTIAQTFGGLPHRQDGVVVYGYPVGGDEISITQGIVSRIEQTLYTYGNMDNLTIQIDAPINPGNSGGPAFDKDGRIVGIAMQGLSSSQSIGYLVPIEVIQHFLNDIKDGKCDGHPDDGITIQTLENKNIKAFYHLGIRDGVLITKIDKNSSADGHLKEGDVILETDGISVAGDSTIKLNDNGRIASNYLIRKHQIGDIFTVKILRGGEEMLIKFPLKGRYLTVPLCYAKEPRYFMMGGMVFIPLTMNYFKAWGSKWKSDGPMDLTYFALHQDAIGKDIDELVVINNIFPNEENANYNLAFEIVTEVDGQKVTSLNQFAELVKKSNDKFVNILLYSNQRLIFNKEKAIQADSEIMKKYGIDNKQRLLTLP
jgi:S1-C subfamily serine protease